MSSEIFRSLSSEVCQAGKQIRFTLVPLGYTGSLGGAPQAPRLVPLAGQLSANLSADVSENLLIPQFVYKTEHRIISLSSALYVPINYQSTAASVPLSSPPRNTTFTSAGLADVFLSPLTVGVHFSQDNNLAIDAKIFAPTGAFQIGNLSNLGMNAGTFVPNVAHTYTWKKRGLEVDNYVAFDIYRQNTATKYRSGTVFHWDGMLFQYLSARGGFGAIISNETQINPDSGPLASRLNGFQGNAWGAGPIVMYVAKVKEPALILRFRWIPEFHVTNLLKGNTLLLGVALKH